LCFVFVFALCCFFFHQIIPACVFFCHQIIPACGASNPFCSLKTEYGLLGLALCRPTIPVYTHY
jgi:hypothetical protein